MKIAIKAYNDTDWLTDTDFIILNLTGDNIKEINNIQSKLKKHLNDYSCQVQLYNIDFKVYSENTLRSFWSNELREWIETPSDSRNECILLKEVWNYDDIPTSESENDVRLDTYMLIINKNKIWCKCYIKYGSGEIYSQEIAINELCTQ